MVRRKIPLEHLRFTGALSLGASADDGHTYASAPATCRETAELELALSQICSEGLLRGKRVAAKRLISLVPAKGLEPLTP